MPERKPAAQFSYRQISSLAPYVFGVQETYCLMTTASAQTDEPQSDQVASVLELFEGNACAAMGALLAELQFVRGQLALCEAGMSVGFTRGWVPSFESGGDSNV